MKTYRLIAVDFDGPLLSEPQIFTAINDDDAVTKARNFLRDHNIELWEGERLVINSAREVGRNHADGRDLMRYINLEFVFPESAAGTCPAV